jgi:hypothetical protein
MKGFPEGLQDLKRFEEEFADESDRGAALISAAWLDEGLGQLIEKFLVDDEKAVNELLSPDLDFCSGP